MKRLQQLRSGQRLPACWHAECPRDCGGRNAQTSMVRLSRSRRLLSPTSSPRSLRPTALRSILPKAESELVAGSMAEYSGFRWSLYFLAEYANMIVVASVGNHALPWRLAAAVPQCPLARLAGRCADAASRCCGCILLVQGREAARARAIHVHVGRRRRLLRPCCDFRAGGSVQSFAASNDARRPLRRVLVSA